MGVIGSAYGVVQSVKSKLRSRRNMKRQRRPERQGPLFEVLEQRLYLSATAAAFATSALTDYGPKPPALMMPLTAGTNKSSLAEETGGQRLPQSGVVTLTTTTTPTASTAPVISQVAMTYLQANGGNWSLTIYGTSFGTQPAFNGTSDYILITDTPINGSSEWGAGYGGDWVWIDVTRWSNNEIDISRFTGSYTLYNWTINAGDQLQVTVANPAGGPASNTYQLVVPNATPATPPVINSVNAVSSGSGTWGFSVSGGNLGTALATNVSDGSYLNMVDVTKHFSIGYIGDAVPVSIASWTDTGISVTASGSGAYSVGSGDKMALAVVNPQTGLVSNQYQFTMPTATPGADGPAITNVSIQPLSGSTDNWTVTITGSNFGTNTTPLSTSPDLLILDTTNNMPAGYTGDSVTANVTSWTDSQIVIQSFGGSYGQSGLVFNPGDQLSITITNPQTGETGNTTVTLPVETAPVISNVSFQQSNGDWTMTVVGSGFGAQSAFTDGTTPYLQISDSTDNENAGYTGDAAKVTVTSWTDTSILVTGFVADNSSLSLTVINPGDKVSVAVWNPQTSMISTAYSTTVPDSPNSPPATDTKVAVSTSVDTNGNWTIGFSEGNFTTSYTIDTSLLSDAMDAAQMVQDVETLLGAVPGFHVQTDVKTTPSLKFSLAGGMYFDPTTGRLDAVSLSNSLDAGDLGANIEGYVGISLINVGLGVSLSASAGLTDTITLDNGALSLSGGGYISGSIYGYAEGTLGFEGKAGVQGTLTADVGLSSAGEVSAALKLSGEAKFELDDLFGNKIWESSYDLGSLTLGDWNWNIEPQIQDAIQYAENVFDSYLGVSSTGGGTVSAASLTTGQVAEPLKYPSPIAGNMVGFDTSYTIVDGGSTESTANVASNVVNHSNVDMTTYDHAINTQSQSAVVTVDARLNITSLEGKQAIIVANAVITTSKLSSTMGPDKLDTGWLPNFLESPLTVGSLWVV